MAENRAFFGTPQNPVIETSEETPSGQGCTDTSLFDGVHAAAMCEELL